MIEDLEMFEVNRYSSLLERRLVNTIVKAGQEWFRPSQYKDLQII